MEEKLLKSAALVLILLAGSCSAPEKGAWFDPTLNHPISVHPHYAMAQFTAPDIAAEMPPDAAARLGSFVADYQIRGHGAMAISVPDGPQSSAIARYFGQHLTALGLPESRLTVTTHSKTESDKVWLQYLGYKAETDACGDGGDNLSITAWNRPGKNFGCTTQQNIAAMVADPHDLAQPHTMEAANGARRAEVIRKYEAGQDTTSKSKTSSVKISDVGGSGSSGSN